MSKILALPVLLLGLGACAPNVGQNVYSAREVGVVKQVERCRVLAVRDIAIQGDVGGQIGQIIGGIAGGFGGGALGNEVGSGRGQSIATVMGGAVGGLVGGLLGERIGSQADRRAGLEYSILSTGGREMTFAQEIMPGDRVIGAGETCRIQTDPYGNNRVLPTTGFPQQIQPPQTTTFY